MHIYVLIAAIIMQKLATAIIASIAIVTILTMVIPKAAIAQIESNNGNSTLTRTNNEGHLPTAIFQDNDKIVVAISKTGETPTGPIIIVPPVNGGNGTIITPGENVTGGGGNVTVIEPSGNVTEIPNGNVTVIDNETVVIAPPDRNITETPANVTVIDPPAPVKPECGCNNGTVVVPPGNNTVVVNPPTISTLPVFPAQNQTGHTPSQLPSLPGNENRPAQLPALPGQGTNQSGNQTQNNGTTPLAIFGLQPNLSTINLPSPSIALRQV